MFKVRNIETQEIEVVLDTYCDEYGKTWFLIWRDRWKWIAANKYCPPNYTQNLKQL